MYKSHSPWSKTSIVNNRVLDIQNKRNLYKDPFDEEVVIPQHMDRRPDLMSFEKYGTAKYWWIFAHRNVNEIVDPINDFTAGKTIRIPKRENIDKMK
jgi:hypothetical protein